MHRGFTGNNAHSAFCDFISLIKDFPVCYMKKEIFLKCVVEYPYSLLFDEKKETKLQHSILIFSFTTYRNKEKVYTSIKYTETQEKKYMKFTMESTLRLYSSIFLTC